MSPRLVGRAVLFFLGVLVGGALAEVVLRAARVGRDAFRSRAEPIADARYGVRLVPGSGGADAWGFNNEEVPDTADLVALGDSQSWGYGVERTSSWPQRLAQDSGRSVYAMALGKYGPIQYLELVDRALALHPRFVVVGLYLGNDLRDAWTAVYCSGSHPELRRADGPQCSEGLSGLRAAAEDERGIKARIRAAGGWRVRLADRTEIFGLLSRHGLWPSARLGVFNVAVRWSEESPEFASIYRARGVRTAFGTGIQLLSLDLDDPAIREGLALTKVALGAIASRIGSAGATPIVLVIPTKITAFAQVVETGGRGWTESYREVVRHEAVVTRELEAYLESSGVAVVKPLPALRAAIEAGVAVVAPSIDNHYREEGHRIFARELQARLETGAR